MNLSINNINLFECRKYFEIASDFGLWHGAAAYVKDNRLPETEGQREALSFGTGGGLIFFTPCGKHPYGHVILSGG